MTLFFPIDGLPTGKQRILDNDTVIKCKVNAKKKKKTLFNTFAARANILVITNEHAKKCNY